MITRSWIFSWFLAIANSLNSSRDANTWSLVIVKIFQRSFWAIWFGCISSFFIFVLILGWIWQHVFIWINFRFWEIIFFWVIFTWLFFLKWWLRDWNHLIIYNFIFRALCIFNGRNWQSIVIWLSSAWSLISLYSISVHLRDLNSNSSISKIFFSLSSVDKGGRWFLSICLIF